MATTPSPDPQAQPAPAQTAQAGKPRPRRRWLLPTTIAGAAVLVLCGVGCIAAVALDTSSGTDPDGDGQPDAAATAGGDSDGGDSDGGTSDDRDSDEDSAEDDGAEEEDPPGYGAGVWEVGAEIPAGTYVTVAPEGLFESCYWARLSGFSGGFEEILANDNVSEGARGRVTIAESDTGVEFTGSCRWVEESDADLVDPGDEVGPGTWAVGEEIEPGTYTTEADDSCYWARLSGFSGEFDDLIANANLSAGSRGRVEIAASDAGVTFTGGCTWTKN